MKIVNVLLAAILLTIFSKSTISADYVAGHLAPRGAPDGVPDVSDILVMERFYQGIDVPAGGESLTADVAPLNNPDDQINIADVMVLLSGCCLKHCPV